MSVLGNGLGALPLVAAVAFGVGAIVAQSIMLFTIIKLLGAAYLIYLGVQAIRHRRELAMPDAAPSNRRVLAEGFVVGLTNPKTAVFFAAMLPQFIDPAQPALPQLLLLGAVFVAIAALCDSLWGLFAGTARSWFASSPRRLRRLSATGGGVMIALGARLAISD